MVNELVLMPQVGIGKPSLESLGLHVAFNLAEDSLPVLMGCFLSVDVEANGVVGLSHAFVLKSGSHVLSTIDVSIVLKRLSVESDVS